ncbi:MAG: hypothetical protein AMXMBFR83_24330 [Phycisphaerae bacterium]
MSHDVKSEHHHGPKVKVYYSVFASLTVLTVLTVAVSRVHLSAAAAVIIAFMIAISKASLVAAFFMHLKYDSRAIHLMAVVPTMLTLLILLALMPDVGMARGPLVAGPPELREHYLSASEPGAHGSAGAHDHEAHGEGGAPAAAEQQQ